MAAYHHFLELGGSLRAAGAYDWWVTALGWQRESQSYPRDRGRISRMGGGLALRTTYWRTPQDGGTQSRNGPQI